MLKIIRKLIYGKEYKEVENQFENMAAYYDNQTESRMCLGEEYTEPKDFKEFKKEFNEVYEKYEELRKKMRL